jgi:hypothetical protein
MTEPSLHAYVVVLSFELPGPLHVNSILAPDAASASALAMLMLMRNAPTDAPLLGCLCVEQPVEQLRHLLRAVETGKPQGEVVSLVPKLREEDAPTHDQRVAEILRQDPESCEHEWLDGRCARCDSMRIPYQYAEKRPLDAADAATFTGPKVSHLWESLRPHPEPFGPPAPGAA